MRRKKRCSFCQELFSPDPRTYSIQKACQKLLCSSARKKNYDQTWRKQNSAYFKARQPKVRLWAAHYPNYWQRYRLHHPLYRAKEKERMRKNRALSVAKQVTITQNPVDYLKTIRRFSLQTVAKQVTMASQIDGILDYLMAHSRVAKPNTIAPHIPPALNYSP